MTRPVQPLYPHTVGQPDITTDTAAQDVDAISDAYDRSGTSVMYINTTLDDEDTQALFDAHQLVAEFDAVRGVDGIRHATDDELAAAAAAAAAKAAARTTTASSKTTTSST